MGQAIDDFEVIGVSNTGLANTTNGTTVYADVTGTPVAVPLVTEDPTQVASLGYLQVNFGATLSKATAGSGTIGVFVNGAIRTDSEVIVLQTQGETRVSGSIKVPRTSGAAQTVKLQAKSSDANVLTVSKAYIDVERIRAPGGLG